MKKRLLSVLLFSLTILFITGCGSSSTDSGKFKPNQKFKYNGVEVVFLSDYNIKKGCSSDFSSGCYEVTIPFEINNKTKDSFDVYEDGPRFDIYSPSGISTSSYNGGYLNTNAQVKMKSGAKLNDVLRFNVKESGVFEIEIKDSKIEIEYDIQLPNY